MDKDEIGQNGKEHELPAPGSVLEKMYANSGKAPIEYRRNRMWTQFNWRRPEEWQHFYAQKKIGNIRTDMIKTRN